MVICRYSGRYYVLVADADCRYIATVMILQALADLANYQYWWSEENREYREQWQKTVSCADKQVHGYQSITRIVRDAVCAEESNENA